MDSEQLREFVGKTPEIVERLREMMYKSPPIPQGDMTGVSTFGPQSPCNDHFMDMADDEVAVLGSVAKFCMRMGTIPTRQLKGFWWVRGRCRGLRGSVEDIMPTVFLLRAYAPEVLETEGIEAYLSLWESCRKGSLSMLPKDQMSNDWLTFEQAADYAEVSLRTIYRWHEAGGMRVAEWEGEKLIHREDIEVKQMIAYANKVRRTRSGLGTMNTP